MIVFVCVDDNNGMLFNHRRQSQDCKLREYILEMIQGKKLWMNTYSAKQFDLSANPNINIDENCVSEAAQGEYCFVEDKALLPYEKWIEQIIMFRWNRIYPADQKFDIPLKEHHWHCILCNKFSGNSHDEITVEVYER